MEFLGFVVRFLLFHRRVVIGILLVIAVALFLTYGLDYLSRFPNKRDSVARGNGDGESVAGMAGVNDLNGTLSGIKKNDDGAGETANGSPGGGVSQREDFSSMDDVGQLLELMNRFRAEFAQGQASSVRLLFARQSIRVAKRLLELDLDEEQRRYVVNLMSDALLMGVLISLEAQYPIDVLEEELLEESELMKGSDDPIIRSKGICLPVTYRVASFNVEPTNERYAAARQAIEAEFGQTDLTPGAVESLCRFLLALKRPFSERERAVELLLLINQRLDQDQDQELRKIGDSFRQTLYFDTLYLSEVSEILRQGKVAPTETVDRLIQGLATFPNTPVPIYQLALDCIRAEINAKSWDKARDWINTLENQAIPGVRDENVQGAIQRALAELKEFVQ
jgi:hypothetical protein